MALIVEEQGTAMSEAETDKPDEVTAAIQVAREFLLKAFQGEKVENLGLEEVRRNTRDGTWDITFGFNRRWHPPPPPNNFRALGAAGAAARPQRTYKVVTVDLNGPKGLSITNRHDD